MKVLYLIETLGIGGSEKSLLQILPRMKNTEVILCALYQGATLKSDFEVSGLRVECLNIREKYAFPKAVHQVRQLVAQERPDVIVTCLFRADLVGRFVGRLHGIPVIGSFVSECYAPIRWQSLTLSGRAKLKGVQLLDMMSSKWVRHYVANSATVRDTESRSLHIPLAKISVIPRGRILEDFSGAIDPTQASRLRKELGLSSNDQVLLNVGRLVDSKGQLELIDAFALLVQDTPNAKLLVAGEGPFRPVLEQRIAAGKLQSQVQLLGERSDIYPLLCLSTLFVFPSHYEGHPGSVIEAMLASRAIVASDIPVHRETLGGEQAGVFVPIGDTRTLAATISELLADPSRRGVLGQAARRRAERLFDVDDVASRLEAVYLKVVEGECAA